MTILSLVFQQTDEAVTAHEAETGFNTAHCNPGFSDPDGLNPYVPPSTHSYEHVLPQSSADVLNGSIGGFTTDNPVSEHNFTHKEPFNRPDATLGEGEQEAEHNCEGSDPSTAGNSEMKVCSDLSSSCGTSHTSSAMPSTESPDPVHSSGGASATGMKQAVSVGHQLSTPQSTQNEAPVSPMMQQEHSSPEVKKPETLEPEVSKSEALEPDVLEPEDLKPEILATSQANPLEQQSLMHPENMPDCSSQVPLTFQMLGLPSGSTTLTSSQQQLLVSVISRVLQEVLEDTRQVESNATNRRNIDYQGDSLNEALQHAAVTVGPQVSKTTSRRSANLPGDESEHVTTRKMPIASSSGEKGRKTEQNVKPPSPGTCKPQSPCDVTTQTEAFADMGDAAGEHPSGEINHHGYPGHVQLHGDQAPSHGNVPLPTQDSLIPDDQESHDTEANESHFYENGEIRNTDGATLSESESISDFHFQNSPSESII